MAKNVVTQLNLSEGAAWTFVHSTGKRTLYEYTALMMSACADPKDPERGLDAMHRLLNPATGKDAMVSEKWLREGPIPGGLTGVRSHWLVGEQMKELAEAA